MTNTLAYYSAELFAAVKRFVIEASDESGFTHVVDVDDGVGGDDGERDVAHHRHRAAVVDGSRGYKTFLPRH